MSGVGTSRFRASRFDVAYFRGSGFLLRRSVSRVSGVQVFRVPGSGFGVGTCDDVVERAPFPVRNVHAPATRIDVQFDGQSMTQHSPTLTLSLSLSHSLALSRTHTLSHYHTHSLSHFPPLSFSQMAARTNPSGVKRLPPGPRYSRACHSD